MHEWLVAARERLAETVGDSADGYGLTEADVTTLLDLARVAAHDSGARTNAPLVAYLVGLAHGRHPERSLDELAAAASGPPAE